MITELLFSQDLLKNDEKQISYKHFVLMFNSIYFSGVTLPNNHFVYYNPSIK